MADEQTTPTPDAQAEQAPRMTKAREIWAKKQAPSLESLDLAVGRKERELQASREAYDELAAYADQLELDMERLRAAYGDALAKQRAKSDPDPGGAPPVGETADEPASQPEPPAAEKADGEPAAAAPDEPGADPEPDFAAPPINLEERREQGLAETDGDHAAGL